MVFGVIGGMASLAPGAEVGGVAVFGLVVKVGDGEHDALAGDGVRLMVAGAAVGIGGAAFAAMAGTVEDGLADFSPVFRIPRPVFDGHGADSGTLCSVIGFFQGQSVISPRSRAQGTAARRFFVGASVMPAAPA